MYVQTVEGGKHVMEGWVTWFQVEVRQEHLHTSIHVTRKDLSVATISTDSLKSPKKKCPTKSTRRHSKNPENRPKKKISKVIHHKEPRVPPPL
jgi:hypothetical protein